MEKMRLGRTGLSVGRSGFGALPIQRISFEESARILRKAYHNGFDFFDTARNYSDSEEKIGAALSDVRHEIIIATKSSAKNRDELLRDLSTSLKNLRTDYVDILQLHNPSVLPDPHDPQSTFAGLKEAIKGGMVRFAGFTNHSLQNATAAALSGLYDTIQFPVSILSTEEELCLVDICKEADCGLIAMKAMGGGLITNAAAAFAFLRQFDNLIPVWGMQRETELDQFLSLEKSPPELDGKLLAIIEKDRAELASQFCRGCGYCLPCPQGIQINMAARMSLLLRRAPSQNFLTTDWLEKMTRIDQCTNCGQCSSRCPYGLNTPELLKENLRDYREFSKSYVPA
ncbi:MAG: aldo/keto reductase [Fibrobacter sp.]|nr:aldo/keto reductase [Fibrobacter sp.]